MNHRKARREVLQALAEFEQGCRAFAQGMAHLDSPADPALRAIIEELGPSRRARRAAVPLPDRERMRVGR